MKTKIILSSLLIALGSLAGCSSDSPLSQSPPDTYRSKAPSAPIEIADITPKVDILFVIDNSNSMDDDQKRLSDSINRFVSEFDRDGKIDFHIGVVSVWDTEQAKKEKYRGMIPPIGQLRPLKDPRSGEPMTDLPPYITKDTPEYLDVLKATLKLGVHNYLEGGPIDEEAFSPVVAALSQPALTEYNSGFLRPDSHVAVVMITDADDASPDISSEELDYFLQTLRGKDDWDRETFSTYAVISDPNDANCHRDKSGEADKIVNFINRTGGKWFSLCDPQFGDRLAEIGTHLSDRLSLEKMIQLSSIPELGTLTVTMTKMDGTTSPIDPSDINGWQYDADQMAIVLRSPVGGFLQDAKKVDVSYTDLNFKNLKNGRAYGVGL